MKKSISLLCIAIFLLFSCKTHQHLAKVEPQNHEFSKEENTETNQATADLIAPYKAEVDKVMLKVIGQCAVEIVKAQPESALGNFCADAIFKMASDYSGEQIDFSIINYGSLRVPYLAAGNITKGQIYELMPFENRLVVLDLPGDAVMKLLQRMIEKGGWPVSASLRYFILNNQPTEITIHGKPFDKNQTYKVALPDYIANGGDNCDFLLDHPRKDFEQLVRDGYFEYILEHTSAGKAIHPKVDGRVAILNQ